METLMIVSGALILMLITFLLISKANKVDDEKNDPTSHGSIQHIKNNAGYSTDERGKGAKIKHQIKCSCGYFGPASVKEQFSIVVCLLLLFLFIIPGIIYFFWSTLKPEMLICPQCGRVHGYAKVY
ncbi:MAG: hypothetical protein ABSB79_16630 [Syntrophales bacterium]|jgi:flagellar basal body-associated protein FliL